MLQRSLSNGHDLPHRHDEHASRDRGMALRDIKMQGDVGAILESHLQDPHSLRVEYQRQKTASPEGATAITKVRLVTGGSCP